jgi:hypothetical protein
MAEVIAAAGTPPVTKIATADLSEQNQSPSISTELSAALLKTAAEIKQAAATDLTNADLAKFMERLKNV